MRAVVGVAMCAVLVAACVSGSGSASSSAANTSVPAGTPTIPQPTPSAAIATVTPTIRPTPTPLGPPMQDIEAAGATRLEQSGDWLQLAAGSAWVAVDGGVRQLDGATGAPKALVPANAICTAMDVGFERLWVADCVAGTVVAIDPAKAIVAKTFSLDGSIAVDEGSVAAGEGAVWVATTQSELVRLDPKTGATTTVPLPALGAGVRAGLGSVWVTVPRSGHVLQIDPKDGSIKATITAGIEPRFLTIGGGSVWVQNNGDGTVTRIGADGVVKATIAVSTRPVEGGDIAFGGGFVWPRISTALIAKLDGTTGELLATYGPPSGSGSVAADDDAAWVSAHDVVSVWRLPLD